MSSTATHSSSVRSSNSVRPSERAISVQPYVFFEGRCAEAIDFYRRALGAEVNMIMHYKDSPEQDPDMAKLADKVMHADLTIGNSHVLMSDGHCEDVRKFEGFALTLTVGSPEEADRFFGALQKGGEVLMPLTSTFFSPRFGMVTDTFGIRWMIYVTPAQPNC